MKDSGGPLQRGWAAGMVLAGVPVGALAAETAVEQAQSLLARYVASGLRAFLFPGFLIDEPELLSALSAVARRLTREAGLGRALVALGGEKSPGFGQPQASGIANPLALAALGSRAAARRAGLLLGSHLAAAGIDLLLSPRLDLASDPKGRAGVLNGFGEDRRLIGRLGSVFARALASRGVSACAGRFPGLGTLCSSSGDMLPLVASPADRLEAVEIRPFAQSVRKGIASVLVGRALVPSLEPDRIPAARSARIIEGRLREELGFKGIAIGDELGPERDVGRAAVLGALAGCDLCLAAEPETALAAAAALEAAAATGELPAPRIVVARRRVENLLAHAERRRSRPVRPSAAALAACGLDIERSMTVLRDRDGFAIGRGPILVVVFLPPNIRSGEAEASAAALREELPEAQVELIHADPSPSEAQSIALRLSDGVRHEAAAILTCDAHLRPAQEGLARSIEESVARCAVVAMRDPYDAAFFPRATTLIAAYGFSPATCRAAGRLLAGRGAARGICPVQVIGIEVYLGLRARRDARSWSSAALEQEPFGQDPGRRPQADELSDADDGEDRGDDDPGRGEDPVLSGCGDSEGQHGEDEPQHGAGQTGLPRLAEREAPERQSCPRGQRADAAEPPQGHARAKCDEQDAGDDLNPSRVPLEPLHERAHAVEEEPGRQEGQGQTG